MLIGTQPGDAACAAEDILQEISRMRSIASSDCLWRSGGNDRPAVISCFRAEIDKPVGALYDFHVVFDDDKAVAVVNEAVEHSKQPGDIVEMQTRSWLIENEQRACLAPFGEMSG
jgi:hypothetical protein